MLACLRWRDCRNRPVVCRPIPECSFEAVIDGLFHLGFRPSRVSPSSFCLSQHCAALAGWGPLLGVRVAGRQPACGLTPVNSAGQPKRVGGEFISGESLGSAGGFTAAGGRVGTPADGDDITRFVFHFHVRQGNASAQLHHSSGSDKSAEPGRDADNQPAGQSSATPCRPW